MADIPFSNDRSRAWGSGPKKLLGRFRQHMEDWGLRRALYWTFMHFLGNRVGFHIHFVGVGAGRRDLAMKPLPVLPPGYDTRICTKADLQPFVDKVPDFSQSFLDTAFNNGDECTASFYYGQLVRYSFKSRARTTVTDQIDVLVPEGFSYGYKAWTHPDHRRKNLGRVGWHVMRQSPEWAARAWGERAVWYVETHNYPSRLHSYTHPRQRAIRMGFGGWFTLFGKQIPFTTRHAKWIGFEFVRKDDDGKRQYC